MAHDSTGRGLTLRELDAEFVKWEDDAHFRDLREDRQPYTLAEADGVLFLCPLCFATKGGPVGTHSVLCWEPNVPQTTEPRPGRWTLTGTSLDDLTLVAGSSSVLLTSGCKAHFHIRNGRIE